MTIRVWLTKAAETHFTDAGEVSNVQSKAHVAMFNGFKVFEEHADGKRYISLSFDPLNPTVELPVFPKGSVRKVTFTGKHFDGFRNDGIYNHKGAVARLETTRKIDRPFVNSQKDVSYVMITQEIQVSAGSIRTLREIYTKIRTGEIKPTEDWGAPMQAPSFEEMLGLMALVSARAHGDTQALN
jgi:hypothetical protein